jgi:hypothetical protein
MCIYIYKKLRSPSYVGARARARKAKDKDDMFPNMFSVAAQLIPIPTTHYVVITEKKTNKWLVVSGTYIAINEESNREANFVRLVPFCICKKYREVVDWK